MGSYDSRQTGSSYKRLEIKNIEEDDNLEKALHDAQNIAEKITQRLPDIIDDKFPNVYLGNVFKSFDKCSELSNAILNTLDNNVANNDNTEFGDLFSQLNS